MSEEKRANKRLGLILLLFPMLVFAGLITMNALNQNSGTSWQIEIDGYDPRDILQGHYITYRYDWNWADNSGYTCPSNRKQSECCLCLNDSGTGNKNPQVRPFPCNMDWEAQSCQSVIKSKSRYGRTLYPSTKFYLSEDHALDVQDLIREDKHEFHIDLSVKQNGSAVIRDMLVDGVPLNEFLMGMKRRGSR